MLNLEKKNPDVRHKLWSMLFLTVIEVIVEQKHANSKWKLTLMFKKMEDNSTVMFIWKCLFSYFSIFA